MDPYTFALVLGGAGLVTMAVTGIAHGGGGGHGHSGAGGAGHGGHGHAGHAGHSQGPHLPQVRDGRGNAGATLLALMSPRVLFSFLLGAGATGLVVRQLVTGIPFVGLVIPALAIVGGVVFERGIVAPLWNFFFRFASRPATTLDASVLSMARATSGFDANGQGLVAIDVDGQIVQCLGTLRAEDRALGVHVRAGDVLRVEDVDPARQRCTVSYIGHEASAP